MLPSSMILVVNSYKTTAGGTMVKPPDPVTKLQSAREKEREREKRHKIAEDHKQKHHEPSHKGPAKDREPSHKKTEK
jgi:hypothetical protein